jgi:hypothetical protein
MTGVLGCGQLLGSLFLCELIQSLRQALGGSPRVYEDDRRVVFLDELEELGVDRWPD